MTEAEKEKIKQEFCDFFIFFTKYEAALKEADYLKNLENSKTKLTRAEPDWDGFCYKIENEAGTDQASLFKSLAKDPDVEYFLNEPPQEQKIKWNNGSCELCFEEKYQKPITRMGDAISACKTVRNNLFHGGKRFWDVVERDRRLIRAATKILEKAKQFDCASKVSWQFSLIPNL